MSPVKAFNIQEDLKAVYGIPGHRRNLRNMARFGGRIKAPYGIDPTSKSWNYNSDAMAGTPYYYNGKNFVSNPNAMPIWGATINAAKPLNPNDLNLSNLNNNRNYGPAPSTTSLQDTKSSFWDSPTAAFAINAGANLLGFGANYLGNRIAASKLTNAYNKAAGIMSDAYGKLQTIDVDGLEDLKGFRAAQYLPITRSANVNVNPQLQDVNRARIRQRQAYRNSTLSDAARLNRSAFFENQAQDQRDRIYGDQANREEQIKQNNNQAYNEAGAKNVQSRNEMVKSLANLRLELAKYNNDIVNERILGAANAQSQMGINAAGAKANAYNAIGNSAANTLNTIGNNAYNIWQNKYNTDRQYLMNLSGSDADATVRSLAMSGIHANPNTILQTYNSFLVAGDNIHARQLRNLFPQYFKF